MASRLEQKERARAERIALEQEQAVADRRKRRIMIIAGAAVAALIVVVAAIVIGSGSSSSKGIAKGGEANKTVATVTSLLHGIPQNGNVLGSPSAPVTMEYFGDLECPVCRDFTLQTLPSTIQSYVRSGKMKIAYKSLQTATQDSSVFKTQQVAALAAGRQTKMWNYVELFYHQQGQEGTNYVNENYLTSLAKQVPGLNVAKWKSDRSAPAFADQVRADATAAQIAGANSTPTLIFRGPKGTQAIEGLALQSDIAREYSAVA